VRSRLVLVAAVGAGWVVLIALRLYQLQVLQHDRYVAKAERQQQRVVTLDPPRGTIYDAAGRELAVSVQVDSVYAVPPEVQDPPATARALAGAVAGLDASRLARQLGADREFAWVARKLDPPSAAAVRRLALPGIYFLPESKRYYPMRELAAQVLGYVGTDNHGLAGLELLYDKTVAGRPGVRTVLRDARRGTVVSPDLSSAEPEPGRDLYLTLDAAVQHVVERELAKAVEERGAKRGSAVFLDPATGGVLAMASYPAFDPNDFGSYPEGRWRNRAIMDVYEPGSTFKVVTAAAALESGVVRAEDEFDCEMGGITVYGIHIRDHKPYGRLTFAQVVAKSSNVGVIKASLLIGGERLYQTIRGFGFGRPTGIDLPGESAGILHPLASWQPITKCYLAFGQGLSVTPLQLATAVAAVANEGNLPRPYVVAAMGGARGREPRYAAPPVVGHPIAPATARELTRLLEGVVTDGTGRGAAIAGYRVAGKTGTAQIPVSGGYSHSAHLPSFVGFAPADRPALVGVVAIDEPQGIAYYGGQVAAPVFGAVARQVLLYLGVRPERQPLAAWPGEPAARLAAATPAAPVPLETDDAVGEDLANPSPAVPAPPRGAPPVAIGSGRAAAVAGGGRAHASL
jgi:cell division protein FtsI (penicillin-binding protein 3)